MCGIFAIIPSANADKQTLRIAMLALANENTARGKQSWGLWSKGCQIVKGVGGPLDGSNRADFFAALRAWDPSEGTWIAGHTRFATHGGITKDNQHPFEKSGLILAHNGVVDVEGYEAKDHVVDSGRIMLSLLDHGYEAGLKKVTGTCALLFSVDGELFAYRSNQSLHHAHGPWGHMVSSAKEHLNAALECAALEHDGDIVSIEESHIMSPWGPRNVHLHCPTGGTGARAPRTFYGSCDTSYGAPYGTYRGGDDERFRSGYSNSYANQQVARGRVQTHRTCDCCGSRIMFEDVLSEFSLDQVLLDSFLEARTHKIAKPYVYKSYDICDTCAYRARSLTVFDLLEPIRLSAAMREHHIKRPLVAINCVRESILAAGLKTSTNKQNPLNGFVPSLIRLEFAVDEDLSVEAIMKRSGLYDNSSQKRTRKQRKQDKQDKISTLSTMRTLADKSCEVSMSDANASVDRDAVTGERELSVDVNSDAAIVGRNIIITEQQMARVSSETETSNG